MTTTLLTTGIYFGSNPATCDTDPPINACLVYGAEPVATHRTSVTVQYHPPHHTSHPMFSSTGLSALWASLVMPITCLTPLTINNGSIISLILKTRTIQPATLTRLSLISSPTIALRSALESSVSIPGSLRFSLRFLRGQFIGTQIRA